MTLISHKKVSLNDPDAELITRMAAGDQTALKDLMDRHINGIQGLSVRMLDDVFAAEDVTQTVFLKTWNMSKDWEFGQAKLLTWMRRVAVNQCLDVLKKKSPIYTDTPPDIEDDTRTAFENVSDSERKDIVAKAIANLPDRHRAALNLSYFEGLSQKEGAAVMEISEAAYESLLVRARRKIRHVLLNSGDAKNLETLI